MNVFNGCKPKYFLFVMMVLSLTAHCFAQQKKGSSEPLIPPVGNEKFSPDAFLIGRDFHHNKFINREQGLKGMAECNFTLADAADPQNYALCQKLGLSVVVSEGPHLTGGDWMKLSDAEIDNYIKKMVEKAGHSKAIIGYHICDEPSALAFPALAKAVAAVKKYAPGKLATVNLYPNYATIWQMDQVKSQLGTKTYSEYLERFVNEVKPQFLSYDNYMVEMSMDLKETTKAAKYYTNLLEVRRVALKYKLPFVNVVSSNQIRPQTPIPSPANLAFQAYTSLAAGAGGIRWYTYHGQAYGYNPIDKEEHKTLTWRYLQEVNRQLSVLGPIIKQLTSTGVYFTSPAPDASLPLLPGKWVQQLNTDAPMMVGEFVSKGGTNYVMVVNLSLEKSARFDIQTKIDSEKIWVVDVGENGRLVPASHKKGIWLTAGQGVLIKCGGEAYVESDEKKPWYY
ncbi:hypothetical protein NIASO_15595 [Niabella soli DSM 19437]|uniref:Glycoside hydrolase family 42 N-terminal domain-containing protein n=2 Tax=Niabella TaxID=379899 RepID=W0EZI1_9BACT|nr:hypothetical protein NIASO_15595 [Niabella soli DSM 19437]